MKDTKDTPRFTPLSKQKGWGVWGYAVKTPAGWVIVIDIRPYVLGNLAGK